MSILTGIRDSLAFWRPKRPPVPFAVQFKKFEIILERNNAILELMADMGDKLGGEYVFDGQYIVSACERLGDLVFKLISDLSVLTQRKNVDLFLAYERIQHQIQEELAGRHSFPNASLTMQLSELNRDVSEEAGNKLANLGDVRNILGLNTPDGFVITSKAFFDFMAHNDVTRRVEEGLACLEQGDEKGLDALSREIQDRILSGEVPRPVAAQIAAMLDVVAARRGDKATLYAVRSSAWGEDAEFSFAGQYESVLAVPSNKVLAAYKRVLASAYSPEVWRYRLHRGYKESETAMAVGCQAMVEAEVSGALYTYAPLAREEEAMVVSATWGLGAPVVDGTAETDTYFLDRTPPHAVRSAEVAHKPVRLAALPGGGTGLRDVEKDRQDAPCLSPERTLRLAQAAMTIERYAKRPQDVEWAFDAQGSLFILQARPLNMRSRLTESCPAVDDATRNAEVIFSGKGTVVQHGVAVGKVFVVRADEDLASFPHGAILVTRHTSPRYSRIMRMAQGIITDVGSATGHMSTLAREYHVPAVVNTGVATSLLKTGDEITLDTTQNAVFRGAVQELCRFELTSDESFEESAEYRLLRRLLKRIAPLNLVDPHSELFKASACRTFHDITRWIHEKAVENLIELSEGHWERSGGTPRRLASVQPLGLMVIDLNEGPAPSAASPAADRTLQPEDLGSVPLGALLDGLTQSGMWSTDPMSVDLGSFMSSFTRTFSSASAAPGNIGRNLAVVSREYMNLHLRLGYHFNIIDAYIGERVNDNYIYFRFLGGVTDFMRRSRRARCIAEILERLDFRVEVHGDLVVGRIKKLPAGAMREKMLVLGGLIGYTRQLDVCLHSDEDQARHTEDFLQRITPLLEVRHD